MLSEKQYLLICLAEECAEVQHRITKALRFGFDEVEPGQSLNNSERLIDEVTDLVAVLDMINESTDLPILYRDEYKISSKQTKVGKFMRYSILQGTLDPTIDSEISNSKSEISPSPEVPHA